MNEQDDILQERLERLEAGESLAACQAGLSAEDAELLQLAAQLQQIQAPVPVAASVAAQRAALLSAAPPPVTESEKVGFFVLLANFFNSPVRMAGAMAVVVVVMLAIGLWANRPASELELAQKIEKETAVSEETTHTEQQPAESVEMAAVDPATAANSTTTTYLPVLSAALATGPGLAALTDIQGLVEIQESGGSWQAVTGLHALAAGTQIRTGALSSAKLTFYDDSAATLGPNTGLTIEQLDAQRPETGFRTVLLNQWQGESRHAVQFRNDGGSLYEVLTPDGSGIARGTKFQVSVAPEQFSRIAVSEGRVDVTGSSHTVSVTPGKLTTIPANEPPTTPAFTITGQGELSAKGDSWIIAGQAFVVNENTIISGDPQIGDSVFVTGYLAADGQNIADYIALVQDSPANQFSLTGIVTEMGDEAWLVAGQTIQINDDSEIDDEIELNDTVHVTGMIGSDGSLTAASIVRLPDETGYPFAFTGVVQQMSDEMWLISGVTIMVDGETAVSHNILVGDIVQVKGLILEDQTWLASSIERVDTTLATFNISGEVQSIDPWQVAGIGFITSANTLIDDDIVVGDAVQVTGRILPDGTWLADSITLLDDDYLFEIIFAGTVDEIDPWVVNGLPLDTNNDTRIDEDIEVGDLVRVTARIMEDGIWLATRIDRLRGAVDEGCVTVTAVVTQIGSGTLTLSNGTSLDMDEVALEGELKVGSVVMIVACVAEDGTIQIEQIIILYTPSDVPTPPPPPGDGDNGTDDGGNVTICHKPGSPAEQTKTVPQSALGGHLGHGDTRGACP
ncbi:MAG: FecR domain-containing protein [Anaerolineae bacterium]|nr:FecR domain-containing protein [Anaerolineae bacterium]